MHPSHHILFNGGTLSNRHTTGIQRTTFELLLELDKIIEHHEIELVLPSTGVRLFEFQNIQITRLPVQYSLESPVGARIWREVTLPNYFGTQHGITADSLLSFSMRGYDVVKIADCIKENFQENSSKFAKKIERSAYRYLVRRDIRRAKVITTCSETSKEDLLKIYKCEPDKINIIYDAWQHIQRIKEDVAILSRLHLKRNSYVLSLGSLFPHKNFKWVIAAAKQNPQIDFVVSGRKIDKTYGIDEVSALDNLTFTGYISDGQLKALMHYCALYVQPSFIEGFGIPPLEAMSLGAKVALSDIPCFHEIYGDTAIYFDPSVYEHINILDMVNQPHRDYSAVLAKYSWKKSAKQWLELMRKSYI